MAYASAGTNYYHGFPTPGPQNPTVTQVMNHIYFGSEEKWKECREKLVFDYVVIGSGFCSYAFVDRIIKNAIKNCSPEQELKIPNILVLERGSFYYPEHFQNLPHAFKFITPEQRFFNETFPWYLARSSATMRITEGATPPENNDKGATWQHGMVPFFGGRSSLWSAWCPRPDVHKLESSDINNWPAEMIDMMRQPSFFEDAENLLGVYNTVNFANFTINMREGTNGYRVPPEYCIYADLQLELHRLLEEQMYKLGSVNHVSGAPLAIKDVNGNFTNIFEKFSVVGPYMALLKKYRCDVDDPKKNLGQIAAITECVVQRIIVDDESNSPIALDTSRGIQPLGKDTKVIIACGCMPAATLLLNSYPQHKIPKVGSAFSAHFISAITARIRKTDIPFARDLPLEFEQAALYLSGQEEEGRLSYHAQITVLSDKNPEKDEAVALKYMPDVVSTASKEQLKGSEEHIVFVYALLGELETKPENHFTMFNANAEDKACNCKLAYSIGENDKKVWCEMEKVGFDSLEQIFANEKAGNVEYWNFFTNTWTSDRFALRVPGMVHESSVVPMGTEDNGAVGFDFAPYGTESRSFQDGTDVEIINKNVYVTGSGLWPSGPSWNPTLTMCAFAQKLADNLFP
jgi:hypothetical protein